MGNDIRMKYKHIELTNGGKTKVDAYLYEDLDMFNWQSHSAGYVSTVVKVSGEWKTYLMHRYIMGAKKGDVIDHKNRNKKDNTFNNLRFCTSSENHINAKVPNDNKSGFRGVGWDKNRKKWRSRINKDGVEHYLGRFDTKEEAIQAYKQGALELYGEFANNL